MHPLHYWLKIWITPRDVLRQIISSNPNHGLVALSFIYGFLQTVGIFQVFSFGAAYPLLQLILGALIFSVPVGYLSISVTSFFLFISGKILRGAGTYKEVRAAYAWSKVPEVINLALLILMLVCWGRGLFFEHFNESISYCFGFLVGRVLLAIQIALGIWGLIILFYGLAEVQKFAVWLGIINVILMTLCYVILFTLLEAGLEYFHTQPLAFLQ